MIYFAKIRIGQFQILTHSEPKFIREIFFVKIGKNNSNDFSGKRCVLERHYSHSVTLLAKMPGGLKEEADMHNRFAHLRLHGIDHRRPEWFYPTDELMNFINTIPPMVLERP